MNVDGERLRDHFSSQFFNYSRCAFYTMAALLADASVAGPKTLEQDTTRHITFSPSIVSPPIAIDRNKRARHRAQPDGLGHRVGHHGRH